LKDYNISLKLVSNVVPRIHQFELPKQGRIIKTVSLIAPSGAANRAVGSLSEYKKRKDENIEFTTMDFRVEQYRIFF
jgi:hypothetical protein